MNDSQEFTVVKGVRYKAEIHLAGVEVMADNDRIADILSAAGFINIDVWGDGRIRDAEATWSGETQTGPMDPHVFNITTLNPPPPLDKPPPPEKEKPKKLKKKHKTPKLDVKEPEEEEEDDE